MKRYFAALALAILAVGMLASCSSSQSVALIKGSSVSIGQIGSINSINTDVSDFSHSANASELANLTTARFYELNSNGDTVANTNLGSVSVVSKNPLTVRYTLNKGDRWSDGTAMDASDLALSFAAGSALGGVDFGSTRTGTGISMASLASPVKLGDNSITLKFSRPVADYENAIRLSVPASVVAGTANPSLATLDSQKAFVIDAVNGKTASSLNQLADAYKNSFNLQNLYHVSSGSKFFVSSGAYRVSSVHSPKELTLVANTNYALGKPTRIETISLQYYADATLAVAAMAAGKIDLSTATDSGLASLKDIKALASAVTKPRIYQALATGEISEQIVFNFGSASVFGQSSAHSLELRKAFLNLVPKQRILSAIGALYSVAGSDSFIFNNNDPYYETSVAKNGSAGYAIQDVEKASELVSATGVRKPINVRVVFDSTNPRAQAEWTLLQDRAGHAGFTLVNLSSSTPQLTMATGAYDVYIGPQLLATAPEADIYALASNSPFGFENPEVSSLLSKLAVAKNSSVAAKLLEQIDAQLFKSAYGMPLYEVPSMVLYTSKIKGFVPAPFASSDTWGYFNWSVATK